MNEKKFNKYLDMIGKATWELAHKNVNSIKSKLIEANQKIIIGSDGQWNTRRRLIPLLQCV